MKSEKLLTVQDLASRLNVPVTWIYQRTRLGQRALPHVRVGKYIPFNINEVMTFLRKNGDRFDHRYGNQTEKTSPIA